MLRPTTLGLALMQAALKVEPASRPGKIANQIVWRGENTTAGVVEEPNGPKPKPATKKDSAPRGNQPMQGGLPVCCCALMNESQVHVWTCPKHGRISLVDEALSRIDEEPPFDTEHRPTVAEVNGEPDPDFYEVQANQYGFPQTFQRNTHGYSSRADSPVCSCCHAAVMLNRGEGTACDKCNHEAYMHMSHDEYFRP